MVAVRGLHKAFPAQDGSSLNVLNDISFDIAPGEFVALTGQSGCGKTTLLRILMGLTAANGGSVRVADKEVTGCAHNRAMVFQHAELLPWRTALENVELGLETMGVRKAERREIARRSLRLVGLETAAERRPDQLSGGMKQRVGLARALAVNPDVLLMDEPFGALDAHTRESLQAELIHLHEEVQKTIVFVTHDLDEAVLLADRVFVLSKGGKLAEIIDIPLERPRRDPEQLRTTPAFAEKRYHIWQTMMGLEQRAAA